MDAVSFFSSMSDVIPIPCVALTMICDGGFMLHRLCFHVGSPQMML
jgi:hypothetical protein